MPMASAGSLFALALAAQLAPVQRYGAAGRGGKNVGRDLRAAARSQYRDSVRRRRRRVPDSIRTKAARNRGFPSPFRRQLSRKLLRLEFGQPLHMDGRTVILASFPQGSWRDPRTARCAAAPGRVDRHVPDASGQSEPDRAYRAGSRSRAREILFEHRPVRKHILGVHADRRGRMGRGFSHQAKPVVFAGFGAGFHWGALLAVGACARIRNCALFPSSIPAYNEEARLPATLESGVWSYLRAEGF